jgi:uncharacterized protein YciI
MRGTLALCSGSLVLAWSGGVAAEPASTPAQEPATAPQTVTYQVVFVHQADVDDPLPEPQARRVATAKAHYEEQLVFDGHSVIAGPLEGAGEITSVVILDVETPQDAEAAFGHNPAMELGQIELEIYPWSTLQGALKRPAPERERTARFLGLLRRPGGATSYSPEELQRIDSEHLAHVDRLREAGDVAAAGPVDAAGDLRALLIFRSTDRRRIEQVMAEDPAIVAGRLRLELYRWSVPRGVIPD